MIAYSGTRSTETLVAALGVLIEEEVLGSTTVYTVAPFEDAAGK